MSRCSCRPSIPIFIVVDGNDDDFIIIVKNVIVQFVYLVFTQRKAKKILAMELDRHYGREAI